MSTTSSSANERNPPPAPEKPQLQAIGEWVKTLDSRQRLELWAGGFEIQLAREQEAHLERIIENLTAEQQKYFSRMVNHWLADAEKS